MSSFPPDRKVPRAVRLVKVGAALFLLVLSSCGLLGGGGGHDSRSLTSHVRTMRPENPPDLLGYSYRLDGNDWAHDVRRSLGDEPDTDKVARVVVHELFQLALARAGRLPPAATRVWYTADGDGQPPFAPITVEEADWVRSVLRSFSIRVVAEDAWLVEPTRVALARIRAALGSDPYHDS